MNSQVVYTVVTEKANLKGYLAIDSMVGGQASGGVRMLPDITSSEMAALAKVMTLKYGFLGIPRGGAKAGIVADPSLPQEKRRALLKAFAESLRPFLRNRSFLPAPDMGTNTEDITFMMEAIGLRHRSGPARGESGYYTALTVLEGAGRAAQHLGFSLPQASVAIEGFGNVGSSVAMLFSRGGSKVVAISTHEGALYASEGLPVEELVERYRQVGSAVVQDSPWGERIQRNELLTLDVDVLSPCARHHSISAQNAGQVNAQVISAGANIPTTAEAEEILFQRGILCLPDFVSNCGGVLGGSMAYAGLSPSLIQNFIAQRIGERISWIIQGAQEAGTPPRQYAEKLAQEQFRRIRAAAEDGGLRHRLFHLGLKWYSAGWVPGPLVRPLAPGYFARILG